jgi:hypothetical protein
MRSHTLQLAVFALFLATPALADTIFFSTGTTDGKMAAATQPDSAGKSEIETGDDFVLTSESLITSATFVGLVPLGTMLSDIGQVRVEIYRVFPADSNVGRTSGSPTFSTPLVPTRVNSPSDVELVDRDSASHNLSFTPGEISASFTAANSVLAGGIHPKPNQTTGGDLPVTGEEVEFNVIFTTPFDLRADHYFFVPQVELTTAGSFLWLSAPRPIVPPGTQFPAGFTDLQAWTRDQFLDPDWLRVGTDIVGGATPPTFNMTFSLTGTTVPEPSTFVLLFSGILMAAGLKHRWAKRPTEFQRAAESVDRG